MHLHVDKKQPPKHIPDEDTITEEALKESLSDNEEDEARQEGEKIAKMLEISNKSNNFDSGPSTHESK
jgi:hypothetical protein